VAREAFQRVLDLKPEPKLAAAALKKLGKAEEAGRFSLKTRFSKQNFGDKCISTLERGNEAREKETSRAAASISLLEDEDEGPLV
jgi:hypothetical protein